MGIRLFVDDIRECPKGWIPARTITEAIRLLSTQDVEEVSLDHDIYYINTGLDSNETFEPVARFVAIAGKRIGPGMVKVRIHTSNFPAGKAMADILGIEYVPKIYDPKDYD